MKDKTEADLRLAIALALTERSQEIADEWLRRLDEILDEKLRDIFPTALLLDHIPSLIVELARVVGEPQNATVISSSLIARKAEELGRLRHEQNATIHQLLREYDVLADIIVQFIADEVDRFAYEIDIRSCLNVVATAEHTVRMILQATVDTFAESFMKTISAQTDTLIEFNNFVSHELKKPLQAALLNAELLLEDKTIADEDSRGLLAIKNSVQQAASMLRNIEDLSPVGSPAEFGLMVNETNIKTLITDIQLQLEEMLEQHAATFIVAPELDTITVNVAKLELILTNLITNAVKYSDPHRESPTIKIEQRSEPGADPVKIAIVDNGIGIAESMHKEVFKLRVRGLSIDASEAIEGHGLGLFLAETAARHIGATIALESVEGQGSTFTVILPRSPP